MRPARNGDDQRRRTLPRFDATLTNTVGPCDGPMVFEFVTAGTHEVSSGTQVGVSVDNVGTTNGYVWTILQATIIRETRAASTNGGNHRQEDNCHKSRFQHKEAHNGGVNRAARYKAASPDHV